MDLVRSQTESDVHNQLQLGYCAKAQCQIGATHGDS